MEPALQVDGLRVGFPGPQGGRVEVLEIPSLTLAPGQQVALKGESGLGKTTLLHTLAGLHAPDSGSIRICGKVLTGLSETRRDRFRAEHIGYVFQSFNLLQGLTALENVELGLAFGLGVDRPKAREALERVGLAQRLGYLPRQLSLGQQQRVAVARALVSRPSLILADEPTGSLDPGNTRVVLGLLRECARELGAALLVATHDPGVLSTFQEVLDLAVLNRVPAREEC